MVYPILRRKLRTEGMYMDLWCLYWEEEKSERLSKGGGGGRSITGNGALARREQRPETETSNKASVIRHRVTASGIIRLLLRPGVQSQVSDDLRRRERQRQHLNIEIRSLRNVCVCVCFSHECRRP